MICRYFTSTYRLLIGFLDKMGLACLLTGEVVIMPSLRISTLSTMASFLWIKGVCRL